MLKAMHTIIRLILDIYKQFTHKQERNNKKTFERADEAIVDTI
jgi:hypothetical protein